MITTPTIAAITIAIITPTDKSLELLGETEGLVEIWGLTDIVGVTTGARVI